MSEDGKTAVVVIALLGNPFSPDYASARRRGPASALSYCSMNVALYARGAAAWSLRERAISEAHRSAAGISLGASSMRWDGDRLVVDIDERTTPLGRPLRGRVILRPEAPSGLELSIDDRGEHKWWPVAPLSSIEVDFSEPGVRFTGHGYHDANAGDVSLETSFENWTWSRARTSDGAYLTYDVSCTSGAARSHAFRVSPRGEIEDLPALSTAPLRKTIWGIPREARIDAAAAHRGGRVLRSLEDGPFYSRSLIETHLGGRPVVAMHESLAAHRLRQSWVRLLTRARMKSAPNR